MFKKELDLTVGNLIDSKIKDQLIEFIIDFSNQSINWLITFESIKNQLRTLLLCDPHIIQNSADVII